LNENEFSQGLQLPGRDRQIALANTAKPRRILVTADGGITYHLFSGLRFSDTFHLNDLRSSGLSHTVTSELYGSSMLTAPNTFSPATCPAPFTAATCPQHGAFSGPDLADTVSTSFYGFSERTNYFQVLYDLHLLGGGSFGYRYRKRYIDVRDEQESAQSFFPTLPNRGACAGHPLDANGICSVTTILTDAERLDLDEHSFIMALWLRLGDKFRGNTDFEWTYADGSYTRISPRQTQFLRMRADYTPWSWTRIGAAMNLKEARNNVTGINNLQHERSYIGNLSLNPKAKWGFDLDYQYTDVYSNLRVCYPTVPAPATGQLCDATPFYLDTTSLYVNTSHYVYGGARWTPTKRLNARVGYSFNHNDGTALLTDALANFGTLRSVFHQPFATVDFQLKKQVVWRTSYNYYGYGEDDHNGALPFRNFHANNVLVALKYSF